jgi:NADPH-dependent curcumin reductase CurA
MFLDQDFTMPDHYGQVPELIGKLAPYIMEGKIQHRSHILDDLVPAIDGLNLFFTGENKGELIVKL